MVSCLWIGEKIKEITNKKSLNNLKLLDIRGGSGVGLIYFVSIHNVHCVGIKANAIHFHASVDMLQHMIKIKNSMPFLPIKGDGLHLKNFGGA